MARNPYRATFATITAFCTAICCTGSVNELISIALMAAFSSGWISLEIRSRGINLRRCTKCALVYLGALRRQYLVIPFFMQTEAMNRTPVSNEWSQSICIRVRWYPDISPKVALIKIIRIGNVIQHRC